VTSESVASSGLNLKHCLTCSESVTSLQGNLNLSLAYKSSCCHWPGCRQIPRLEMTTVTLESSGRLAFFKVQTCLMTFFQQQSLQRPGALYFLVVLMPLSPFFPVSLFSLFLSQSHSLTLSLSHSLSLSVSLSLSSFLLFSFCHSFMSQHSDSCMQDNVGS
jgi:hypothetical protein